MTLKDVLKCKKIYVARWEDVTEEAYSKITIFNAKKRKPLVRVLRFDEETKIYFGTQEQKFDDDIKHQILDEINQLYRAQVQQKSAKKAEAERKAFENRKNAVYKKLIKEVQK